MDTPPRTAELVVIGGGIVGAATAFYAARAGISSVLIEARPALCTLTTPVSTGAFRLQFSTEEELRLVEEIGGALPELRRDHRPEPLRPRHPRPGLPVADALGRSARPSSGRWCRASTGGG